MKLKKTLKVLSFVLGGLILWGLIVNFVISPLSGSPVTDEDVKVKKEEKIEHTDIKSDEATNLDEQKVLEQQSEKITADLKTLAEVFNGLITGFEAIEGDLNNGIWVFVSDEMRLASKEEKEYLVSGSGYEIQKIISSNGGADHTFAVYRYQSDKAKMAEYFNGKTTIK